MQIVFLGLPGAGKGTQAISITEVFGIPHIATGDIFRAARKEQSELGTRVAEYLDKGLLVPDALTIEVVRARLSKDDTKSGFLLDGFPRTEPQAVALEAMLQEINKPLTHVLYLEVPKEELLQRLTGRLVCSQCGASYHVRLNPPAHEGVCDRCNAELITRKDDTPEAVAVRLEENLEKTKALVAYYDQQGILRTVDGTQSIEQVKQAINRALTEAKA
jgi:adenylate kinase